MEEEGSHPPPSGVRQSNLKKSFKLGIRSLLTACSKEEFCKVFSAFNKFEQQALYKLFIQVITSLHENIEQEFESICDETKVATTLDTVEQLVEEQSLDILSQDKTNVLDVKQEELRAKKVEVSHLTHMLEKATERNHQVRTHIESLKNRQEFSTTADAVGKLRSWNSGYGQIS